jgi:hypothetical protein
MSSSKQGSERKGIQGKCKYCHTLDNNLTKDHVLPKSRFPKAKIIIMVCVKCNSDKRDKTLEEWAQQMSHNDHRKFIIHEMLKWDKSRFKREKHLQLLHAREIKKSIKNKN